MRIAVVADLHGRGDVWPWLRDDIAAAGVEDILFLGDYLDCLVSERRPIPVRRRSAAEVVEVNPGLWADLAGRLLVRGSQEDRVAGLLEPADRPPELAALLAAPAEIVRFGGLFVHGHRLPWASSTTPPWRPATLPVAPPAMSPVASPAAPDVPPRPARLVFAGHSHRTQLLRRPTSRAPWEACPVEAGRWVPVPDGSEVFVNVGPARSRPAQWLGLDVSGPEPDARVVALHFTETAVPAR